MHFWKTAIVAASVATLGSLAACGGGGGDPAPEDTSRFGQSVTAPANTLVVSGGDSAIPQGNHALDTGYTNASGLVNAAGHVIEWVYPEADAFDSILLFAQDDPRKFAVSVTESGPTSDRSYACLSAAWTALELSELAAAIDESDLSRVPKCPANITLNGPGHHIDFKDWTLVSTDGAKSLKFSINVSWLLQNGTFPTGGSGSGSSVPGSSTGPISSGGTVVTSGGAIVGASTSGSTSSTIRILPDLLADAAQPDPSAVGSALEASGSR